MTLKKRSISLFMAVVLVFSLAAACASAAQNRAITTGFVQTSKEEYIQYVANAEGISEEEVLARIESKWDETRNQYGIPGGSSAVPYGFDFEHSEVRDDGITLLYGFVSFVDTYAGVFEIRTVCPAVIAAHHYGRTFYEVDPGSASVVANNDGAWTLAASGCSVYSTNTTVTIDYWGIIDCPLDVAIEYDVLDFFSAGISQTSHGHEYVVNSNSYTC